jgi:hypothetical protein
VAEEVWVVIQAVLKEVSKPCLIFIAIDQPQEATEAVVRVHTPAVEAEAVVVCMVLVVVIVEA